MLGVATPEPQSTSMALDAERFKYVADVVVEEAGIEPSSTACASPRWSKTASSAA